MENESLVNTEVTEQTAKSPIQIYSKTAVLGFSIFFGPIFGGVLLFQNLRKIQKKQESNWILAGSISYTLFQVIANALFHTKGYSFSFSLSIIGGLLLGKYFFTKYIPENPNYETKPIWTALIISLIITIPLLILNIMGTTKN